MAKQIGVEVLDIGGYYCVELCNHDNRRITLRSYQRNEQKQAVEFASEVAIIIQADWELIHNT